MWPVKCKSVFSWLPISFLLVGANEPGPRASLYLPPPVGGIAADSGSRPDPASTEALPA